jgi:glycosyltransferase involved in cell wall biosynthesis
MLKRFILLHDVIPLVLDYDYCNSRKLNQHFFDLIDSINANDYYFANSQYTKSDFCKYVPAIDPQKIQVTYLAASSKFHLVSNQDELLYVRQKYGIDTDKKYMFSLCTLVEHKNLANAAIAFLKFLREYQITDMIFVLGGAKGHLFLSHIRELVDEEDFKNIQYIGYVADDDLAPLYNGSSWFVYTSRFEGFGLPVLEAMQCGCPVITSTSTSLPEVIGDAGLLVDSDSIEQHIEAYKTYYFDDDLRNRNAKKGLARAELFSWEKTANAMLDVFKQVTDK